MNNSSIKARADELIAYCKPQYIRILFIMALVGMIPNVFSSRGPSAILFLIVNIALVPFSHGYIVTTLKIVRNNYLDLSDDDAFVGLKRFKELFFTYFLYSLVVTAALFVVAFVLTLFVIMLGASLQDLGSFVLLTVGLSVLVSVISMLVGLYGFAFPYLLEKYGYTGMDAIKESFRFIKGHVLDLFKLELSYLGWTILVALVEMILAEVLVFLGTTGALIAAIASGAIAIFTYLPQYHVARAIFFEEIAYQRYGHDTSYANQNTVYENEETVYDDKNVNEVKQIEELGEQDVQ